MGSYKKFSKELFAQNDKKARKLAKEFYAKSGIVLKDNPKKYGPDLMRMENGKCVGFVECEIKRVWKDDAFPYGSVQFPERKAKYVYTTDLPVEFFMLNNKCNRVLKVDGKDILKSPLKSVRNIYMTRGDEMFFQVPLEKVTFLDL